MPDTPRASPAALARTEPYGSARAGPWIAALAEAPRRVRAMAARVVGALGRVARSKVLDGTQDRTGGRGMVGSASSRRGASRSSEVLRDRVLVVDHRMLTPDQDSGSVRMLAILKLLGELGHDVTFVAGHGGAEERGEAQVRPHASEILYGLDATEQHLLREGGSYRFAVLSRPEQARQFLPLVRALAPRATVIYDTVDLHWVRLTRASELTGDPALLLEADRFRRLERGNVSGCDLTLAITEQERSTLLAELPEARVELVPNIHAVEQVRRPLAGRRDLLFIGGYEHQPNVDAVQWFVAEILPRILEHLPDVVFRVVGSKPTEAVRRLASASVEVVGYLPEAGPCFERSRVFVSPLRYGAGMKGKIGQAMTFGLPVVTTSVGAEGLRLVDGENALVADGPAPFAEAVVRLYQDASLWERLSDASRRHVERNFSEDAVRRTLAAIFPARGSDLVG